MPYQTLSYYGSRYRKDGSLRSLLGLINDLRISKEFEDTFLTRAQRRQRADELAREGESIFGVRIDWNTQKQRYVVRER